MQRTLYILTKHIASREHELDEFVTHWLFRSSAEEAIITWGDRKVVFMHGYLERFPEQKDEEKLIRRMREVVDTYVSHDGEKGLICHPSFNPNLPLKPSFASFAFADVYSIGASRGEWALLQNLIPTYTHTGVERKVIDIPAFEAAFDAVWNHYKPNRTLRDSLEERHREIKGKEEEPRYLVQENNQTEHYLLIWNAISLDWFTNLLLRHLTSLHDKQVKIIPITSRQDYDSIDWTKNWRKIFVLAELFWSDTDFEGVSLVLDILRQRDDERLLEILTCSVLDRLELHEAVMDKNKLVVKSFPHLCLSAFMETTNDFSILERMHVSVRKWRYKRAELLGDREILATLLHGLTYIEVNSADFRNKAIRFHNQLSNLRSILDEDSLSAINKLKNLLSEEDVPKSEINSCIRSIEFALSQLLAEHTLAIEPVCIPARLMIVDDEEITRHKIQAMFSPWFSEVIPFETGSSALMELKKDGIRFDGLIVDLELLDENGFEDLVQGVDLVDFCERFCKHIAIRVVTGLPRNSIPKRLSEFKNDRIVLKQRIKMDGNESPFILPHFDEREFMLRMSKEVEDLSRLYKLTDRTGPSNGKFARSTVGSDSPDLTAIYYEWKEMRHVEFEERMDEVFERVRRFLINPKENPVNTRFARPSNDLRSTWEKFLWDLLVLRLIAITRQKQHGSVPFIDFGDDSGLYFDLGLTKTLGKKEADKNALRGWFNTRLGFSFEPEFLSEKVKIRLHDTVEELFPHENRWKQDVNLDELASLGERLSLTCCANLQDQIYKIIKLVDSNRDENTFRLIQQFSSKTTFDSFRKIMLFLVDYPGDRKVSAAVRELLGILVTEYDEATDVIIIPSWLEKMIDR